MRNARGGNVPDLLQTALNCEAFGAQGITVHPRPDERHIRYSDVRSLAPALQTEFNIEGYPSPDFIALVLEAKPTQVTLVPDPPGVLTSNAGWDAIRQEDFLREVIQSFQQAGIRSSLFMECDSRQLEAAARTGTDRVELYTEAYAQKYPTDPAAAVAPFAQAARVVQELGLGLNAGHDLNHENLRYFAAQLPGLLEVSIGHALIAQALYWGLENTIQVYLRELELAALDLSARS